MGDIWGPSVSRKLSSGVTANVAFGKMLAVFLLVSGKMPRDPLKVYLESELIELGL